MGTSKTCLTTAALNFLLLLGRWAARLDPGLIAASVIRIFLQLALLRMLILAAAACLC